MNKIITNTESPLFEFKVQDILKDSETGIHQESDSISNENFLCSNINSNITELNDGLVLCSASVVTPNILEVLNITCVVNVAPELPDTPLHNDDVIYHKISIMDSGNSRLLPHFNEAVDLIHKVVINGGRSLVYCVAGVSRSASICIAYFMKHCQMSLLEAYNFVKSRRPKIKPNCGFFKQLIEYEKDLYGFNTVHMVFNKLVNMEIPDVYDSEYKFTTRLTKRLGQSERY